MRNGHLFVFSGPSGVGKGTVLKRAIPMLGDMVYSVSCTTRKPRAEDIEGKTYHFLDERAFQKMVDEGLFLEWARVYGNFYGTRKDIVESTLASGLDVILEIDVQGGFQIKKKMPDSVSIFIAPPSFEELKKRLKDRKTETEKEFDTRIDNAMEEMKYAHHYDHLIINTTVEQAVLDFINIVKKYREE